MLRAAGREQEQAGTRGLSLNCRIPGLLLLCLEPSEPQGTVDTQAIHPGMDGGYMNPTLKPGINTVSDLG